MTSSTEKKRLGRKIVSVPHEHVIGLLLRWRVEPGNHFRIPIAVGLPDTARVVSVHECFERASFAFIVEDESFPKNEPGMRYEEIFVTWEVVRVPAVGLRAFAVDLETGALTEK